MKNIYKRQTNFVTPGNLDFPILLIGCGGTGSWAGMALAKMGCTDITLVDFDHIEPHNIPSQMYNIYDGKELKVKALSEWMGNNIKTKNPVYPPFDLTFEKYFKSHSYKKISVVICTVDSMDERIRLWDIVKKRDDVDLYLDPRIGGELLRLYAVDPLNAEAVKFYESKLYPSSKADPLPCGSRQIIYTTMFTGALIANYVKKYAKRDLKNASD